MEIVKFEFEENKQEVLSLLKREVFHLTTREAFQDIFKCGMLFNNKDGRFKINPSSMNSFGRHLGYVCFFDLRRKSDSDVEDILYKYNFITPYWFRECHDNYIEWNLAYMILSPEHYNHLIPYEKAIEYFSCSGKFLQTIPHVEAWIFDHVPIKWFHKTYIVHIEMRLPECGTYARVLYDMEINQ